MATNLILPRFRRLFTDLADIYGDSTTLDDYGQSVSVGSVLLDSNIVCKLICDEGTHEFKTEKKVAVSRYILYIMPWTLNGKVLSEHLWLMIAGVRYNIIEVLQPTIAGAHCELTLERVKP